MGRAGQAEAIEALEGGGQLQVLGGPLRMRPGWGRAETGSSPPSPQESLLALSPVVSPSGLGLVPAPSPLGISASWRLSYRSPLPSLLSQLQVSSYSTYASTINTQKVSSRKLRGCTDNLCKRIPLKPFSSSPGCPFTRQRINLPIHVLIQPPTH